MPIRIDCPSCSKKLQVPDGSGGKRIKCPGCQTIIVVPPEEPVAAGVINALPETPPRSRAVSAADDEGDYKPCPMCGERIASAAAKCRFCGEIFDPELRTLERKKKVNASDQNLSVGEWVVAILCNGIGCIVGIVWMIQGKPKGAKMFGVSLLVTIIGIMIQVLFLALSK